MSTTTNTRTAAAAAATTRASRSSSRSRSNSNGAREGPAPACQSSISSAALVLVGTAGSGGGSGSPLPLYPYAVKRSPSSKRKGGFVYELMKDDEEGTEMTFRSTETVNNALNLGMKKNSPTRVVDFDAELMKSGMMKKIELEEQQRLEVAGSMDGIDDDDDEEEEEGDNEDNSDKVHDLPPQQLSFSRASSANTDSATIFRQLAPNAPSSTPPTPLPFANANSSFAHRRSRQYFSSLPTLDETSSSEDDSFEEDDPAKGTNSPPSKKQNRSAKQKERSSKTSPSSGPLMNTENNLKPNSARPLRSKVALAAAAAASAGGVKAKPKSSRERVLDLQVRADDLAHCGEEEKALHVYKKALKITRNETARIKGQLKQVDDMHPSTVKSIHSRLHEDWLQVGWSIASIRAKMAILCERLGDYDSAITCCNEASDIYKRQLTFVLKKNKVEHVDRIQKKSAEMKLMHDKMAVAKDSFPRRKAMHEEIMLLRRIMATTKFPDLAERNKMCTSIEAKIKSALRLEMDILGDGHPQVADTMSLLAALALEHHPLPTSQPQTVKPRSGMEPSEPNKRALYYMDQALTICQKALGNKHPLTGEMMLQIARIHITQQPMDEDKALRYFEEAVTVFRGSQRNPRLVASTLNEISVIRIRRREYEKSIELLMEALDICNQLMIPSPEPTDVDTSPPVPTDAVQIWRNLGECHACQRHYEKAADAFVRALELQREARKAHDAAKAEHAGGSPSSAGPEPPLPPMYLADDESIADTLRRLGKSYVGFGKHNEALKVYGEALLIHRAAVIKAANPQLGRPDRDLPERQDQLAHTLFCIAEVRETMGQIDDALRIYSESMQLRLFSDAHRQDKRVNLVHCAMCLRGIGNIHLLKREFDAAHKVFEDALSYCRGHGVPEQHPILLMIKQRLEEADTRLTLDCLDKEVIQKERAALSYRRRGELDKAIDALTKAMAARKTILKTLKNVKQDTRDAKRSTAFTLKTFGKVLMDKGDWKNAERAYGDALKLLKKVMKPGDEVVVDEVKSLISELKSQVTI